MLGLGDESAVVALELYRRQGAWKIRAVGQGYAAGLAALLADQGLPDGRRVTKAAMAAVAVGRDRSSAAADAGDGAASPDGDPARTSAAAPGVDSTGPEERGGVDHRHPHRAPASP